MSAISSTWFIDILPDLKVRGFQAQAAIALEERLTSPTKREDAPSLLVRIP